MKLYFRGLNKKKKKTRFGLATVFSSVKSRGFVYSANLQTIIIKTDVQKTASL